MLSGGRNTSQAARFSGQFVGQKVSIDLFEFFRRRVLLASDFVVPMANRVSTCSSPGPLNCVTAIPWIRTIDLAVAATLTTGESIAIAKAPDLRGQIARKALHGVGSPVKIQHIA
jgi:hypothetical protein